MILSILLLLYCSSLFEIYQSIKRRQGILFGEGMGTRGKVWFYVSYLLFLFYFIIICAICVSTVYAIYASCATYSVSVSDHLGPSAL